ncbi:MAG: hypothetical protein OEZ30_07495, partial [Candidatus Aminicenantes bacterium]|nr:hypothetical protein [Candidatus Aminicenantes bacterium]
VKCYILRYEQARISHIGINTRKCVSESNRLAERVSAQREEELIENQGCACSSVDRATDF